MKNTIKAAGMFGAVIIWGIGAPWLASHGASAAPSVCWETSATATAYVATAEFRGTAVADSVSRELAARATELAEARAGQCLPVEPGDGP